MKTTLTFTMAWRNLWRHTRRTILTVATIALGLVLLLISFGLNDGGHAQMIESAVELGSGHVLIQQQGYLESAGIERFLRPEEIRSVEDWVVAVRQDFPVTQVVKRVFASGLASSADGAAGVLLIGMEPEKERTASVFHQRLIEGDFPDSPDSDRVIIGRGVGRKLALSIGDRLVLTAQAAGGEEIQAILTRVGGVFETGLEELDQSLILMPIATAQSFLVMDQGVHQVAILLESADSSEALARRGQEQLPGVEIVHWSEAHPELVDFIRIDDAGGYLFFLMIFVLIGFLVLNTLLMAVLERNREFALLEAVGMSPGRRFAMVMMEALIIAALAVSVGLVLGYGGHLYLAERGLPLDLFYAGDVSAAGVKLDPVMYSRLTSGRILSSTAMVFALTLFLALFPARRAAVAPDMHLLGRA
jgi:ABC-type lipoprotein release transport system permease subunit